MTWITWLLGTLGVGGLAVAAGFVFAPAATLSLLKNLVSFVVEKTRDAVKWARDPERNWWKIGCVSFASFFAVASWYADSQRRQVIYVTNQCAADKLTIDLEFEPVREAARKNFAELQACVIELERIVGEDQETERLNAEAVARAEARARAAAAAAEDWRRRYQARPATCTAALSALEEACATVSDY